MNYDDDIKSQVDYAVYKYGGNLPPSVARANAEKLAKDAMKNYDPRQGGVKTYLSARLQKLSRQAYQASIPMKIPESRLMNRSKIRDFIEEYKDTYGSTPQHDVTSKHIGVPIAEVKSYSNESATINNESSFDNISSSHRQAENKRTILHSLPKNILPIGLDIYSNGLKEKQVMKKHQIGRTSYFAKKKKIDAFLRDHSEKSNIERR